MSDECKHRFSTNEYTDEVLVRISCHKCGEVLYKRQEPKVPDWNDPDLVTGYYVNPNPGQSNAPQDLHWVTGHGCLCHGGVFLCAPCKSLGCQLGKFWHVDGGLGERGDVYPSVDDGGAPSYVPGEGEPKVGVGSKGDWYLYYTGYFIPRHDIIWAYNYNKFLDEARINIQDPRPQSERAQSNLDLLRRGNGESQSRKDDDRPEDNYMDIEWGFY